MLTYSANPKPKRKDRPWLLFLTAIIWIIGATFLHDPWEPYEPFVAAIVKSIIAHNSWLVPYLSSKPYLDLQPFYFWIFAIFIKLFHFSNIVNAVRMINSVLIFIFIAMMGRIGSNLNAYKNGRSVVMILISTIGVINNAYQLSPNMVVLLGFALYFYALQRSSEQPGISGWLLSCGLLFISIHFTGEFLIVALLGLILLPLLSRTWRERHYLISLCFGLSLFILIFGSYVWRLYQVDPSFYYEWRDKYTNFISLNYLNYLANLCFYLKTLAWYLIPAWFLCVWTLYKRRRRLFEDKILQLSVLIIVLLFFLALINPKREESVIFPIIIPIVLLASVEIDSIKISVVSLFNWFCLVSFGLMGLVIATLYAALNFSYPRELFSLAKFYAPQYVFRFNVWQLALALIITLIWLFMITRKHIRGREMVSNWASGTTFVLVMFVSLCMPWFNAVLSFKDMVISSIPYIESSNCVATLEINHTQNAIWYYYTDIYLLPQTNLNNTVCDQALITIKVGDKLNYPKWNVLWSAKRPIDTKQYVLLSKIK